jgi:hypothetical protein
MVFGHNTNVKLAGVTYHVQTEDRGESHALIDTTVYFRGRVLHRRTNNYFDLLPLNEDSLQALKLRLDQQHQTVLEEMQSGALQLAIPQPTAAMSQAQHSSAAAAETPSEEIHPAPAEASAVPVVHGPRRLTIDLTNPRSWLSGKRAALQLLVKEENGDPVVGAKIDVHIDGSAEHQIYSAVSGSNGLALVEFGMPRITAAEAAIAIHAEEKDGRGHLKFSLRAKPKVSSL